MDTFVVACFAIPILSTAATILKDQGYKEGIAAMAKKEATWTTRFGTKVSISSLSDHHLANVIKMVARNCHSSNYLGEMARDTTFKNLIAEARNRKIYISILKDPIIVNGRKEYVEVLIPTHRSGIATGFFPPDIESRPQE
jgi:hypothetical protein